MYLSNVKMGSPPRFCKHVFKSNTVSHRPNRHLCCYSIAIVFGECKSSDEKAYLEQDGLHELSDRLTRKFGLSSLEEDKPSF